MLCVWWCAAGLIHFELVPEGHTINAEVYSHQLQCVQDQLRRAPYTVLSRSGPLLLHDNARPHVAALTQKKIEELGWTVLPHPAYSPDIAPSDFHLFRSLAHFLKGQQFQNDLEVKSAVSTFFHSKNADFYRDGILSLPDRWRTVVARHGNYFQS